MEKEVVLPKAMFVGDYMLLKKDWDIIKNYFEDSPTVKQALAKSRVYPAKDKKSMVIAPSLGMLSNVLTDMELTNRKGDFRKISKKEFHFVLGKWKRKNARYQICFR